MNDGSESGLPLRPTYAAAFRCIGSSCEDTCCRGWRIPLDRHTCEQYQQFPQEKLGSIVSEYVTIATTDSSDNLYARINLAPSGLCPFYTPDQLCGIQKEYGPGLLSATCSIYPRTLNDVGGKLEGTLSLSCPEATRNILLNPDALQVAGNLFSGEFRTDNVYHLARNGESVLHKPYEYFHAVRALLVEMVRDRKRPVWQRLVLIGSLCERLNASATPQLDAGVPAILEEYRGIVQNGWLHAELEGMARHPEVQLKVILKLTDERVRDSSSGERFRDTFWDFIEGIGTSGDAQGGSDIERYQEAERKYHRPFFERFPFIQENYLLNYMFQNLFPFGQTGSPHFTPKSIFDEYVLMATQFAWINGLLIGIAGRYREEFSEEQIVRAVQSFSRAVEHYPLVLISINEFIRNSKLDNLAGMAVILRN